MQLKSQVEWALHCCSILAGLPPEGYLATRALAELHGVPKEYLSKALQALSNAGLITGTLGPAGGYRLARPASDITFLEVVEAVEGSASTFVCTGIRDNNPCATRADIDDCDRGPCAIARIMWEADKAWRDSLRSVRLSDLRDTLERDIPADLWRRTGEWVIARA
jgi:Rrf2 family protein